MKRQRLKPISSRMAKQRRLEKKLEQEMVLVNKGRCDICRQIPDFRGLHKHEIIRRGQQGDELSPVNCLLLCMVCHDHRKYPTTGTPLTIEEQLKLSSQLYGAGIDEDYEAGLADIGYYSIDKTE